MCNYVFKHFVGISVSKLLPVEEGYLGIYILVNENFLLLSAAFSFTANEVFYRE